MTKRNVTLFLKKCVYLKGLCIKVVVLTSLEMFSFFLSLPLMFYFIYIQKVYTFSFVFEESLWVKDLLAEMVFPKIIWTNALHCLLGGSSAVSCVCNLPPSLYCLVCGWSQESVFPLK